MKHREYYNQQKKEIPILKIIVFLFIVFTTCHSRAQETTQEESRNKKPVPTYANFSYGPHERQVFDIWLTSTKNGEPTPLVIYIHGGGFLSGNKNSIGAGSIKQFMEAGLSVAAIEYRLSDAGPYPIMMKDAARCLQTIRSHAKEWNLNPDKVACYGGSAGAGISLWLGFHDDMGDLSSDDPISRQSTRITAVATINGQSTYDLYTFRDWFGVPDLKNDEAHYPLFDVKTESEWDSERVRRLMADASPITHLTKDDIPVYMFYFQRNVQVDKNTPSGVWVHHPKLGLKLQEAMKNLGLECEVKFPEHPVTKYESLEAFIIEKLSKKVGAQELPTIKEKTANMESQDGFIPIHYDPVEGRLYLEVSIPNEEFLYHSLMATGIGIGIPRGYPNWMASEAIVRFERRGPDLILLKKNVLAVSIDPDRTDSTEEAQEPFLPFLEETFPIVAEEAGRVLVDGTDHFLQDVHGVPKRLAASFGEEGFFLNLEQSSIFRPSTRALPENTEVEALLTFVTNQPGEWARNFLPDSATLVLRQRHSLSKLPEPGFPIRRADSRLGFATYPFLNPSPVGPEDFKMDGVCRWRLEKLDPVAPVSEVVEPIAVYLDAAMPENIRESARLGMGYWKQVLENVGLKNAISIRDLHPDADPLDPRFPLVILWDPVKMASQSFPVVDVRTGEIVKAVILVAGYEERSDRNFYRAIEPVLETGQPDLKAFLRSRVASTVAHEAGHALAFLSHNNTVPSMMGMSRPRLRVGPSGGLEMDLSVVFPEKPFPYDEWIMRYAYAQFEPGEEDEGLIQIVEDGLREGLHWGNNRARRANPRANARMHSDDPLMVLEENMAVRRLLMERFGPEMLHPGEPESLLFERFIPIYFFHQHSLSAVTIMLGSVEFTYEPANDYQRLETAIDFRAQRRALDAILNALSPEELLIPLRIAEMIPPKLESSPVSDLEFPVRGDSGFFKHNYFSSAIWLPLQTEGAFDPLGWVRQLSTIIVRDFLRQLPRVASQHSAEQTDLSGEEFLSCLVDKTWGTPTPEQRSLANITRLVRNNVLDRMIRLIRGEEVPAAEAEMIRRTLERLLTELQSRTTDDPIEKAHLEEAIRRIAEVVLGEAP